MLVGKVNTVPGGGYDEDEFFAELEQLMFRHGVNRVEAYWGVPGPCPRCGEMEHGQLDGEFISMLEPDDPRLRDDADKDEALDMLGRCVGRMGGGEISLERKGDDE